MRDFTLPGTGVSGAHEVKKRARDGSTRLCGFLICFALAILFLFPVSVFAQHPYEFLDENVRSDGGLDWETIWDAQESGDYSALPAGSITTNILFDAAAPDTIYFGGNTKDHLPISGWDWQTSNSSSSDKTNILESGAILIGGKIYFFGNKFAAEGTTTIGFWFFQDEVSIDPEGGFNGEHTPGDILIVADVEQGGAVGVLNAYKYVGVGNGTLPNSNNTFVELDTDLGEFGDLYGVVNTLEQPTPWPHQSKNFPPNSLPPITFFEGFIDIAALELTNACFSSFLMETRSSNPVNSALEDFNLGGFNVTPLVSVDDLVLCEDELPSSLTATVEGGLGTITFEWRKDGELLAETSSTVQIDNITDAGSYSVRAIGEGIGDIGDCPSEEATATVTIDPVATADAGDDQDICIVDGTETVQLDGEVGGGASSGTWSGGAGTFDPNANALDAVYTPTAGEISSGMVTLTLTTDDPEGPCDAAEDDVVINFFEDATADAGDDQDICIVDGTETVQLDGEVGGGASSGTWSGGAGTFDPNANALDAVYTPTAGEISSGMITLTLTTDDPEGPCDAAEDDVVINFFEDATADAGDDQDICIVDGTETVQLDGEVGGGASSGTWSGGAGTFDPNANTLDAVYTPTAGEISSGMVTLTLTTDDPEGPCDAAEDDVVINFTDDATADAGDDQDICIVDGTETVQLDGEVGGGASSGTWSGGAGTFDPNANTLDAVYTPTAGEISSGMVTLTLTSDDPEGPCEAAEDDVVINFFEDATANAGDNQSICIIDGTETVQLAGEVGGGASSGTWSGGAGTFDPNANALNAVYTPTAGEISSGMVTLTLTTDDPEGPCEAAEDDVVIYLFQNPDAGEDGSAQFCFGDSDYSSVNLFNLLQGDPDEGGSWMETSVTSSGLVIGDGSGLDFTGVLAGVYTFVYTVDPAGENSNCEADEATVTITIDPLPEAPDYQTSLADCLGGDGGLVFTNAGDNLYYSIDGADFVLYDGEISLAVGTYSVRIRYDEDGCISDAFEVEIQRPGEDIVTLMTSVIQPDCDTFMGTIMITNAGELGDLNYTVTNQDTSTDYYTSVPYPMGGFTGLPAGNYYISVISDNGCVTGNVMVTLDEPVCEEFEGCTLGYWKNHTDRWCDAYSTCDLYGDIFEGAPSELAELTLQEVLNLGGGGIYNLGRQSVAALLNACSEDVNFELLTPQDVIDYVTANFNNAGAAGSYLDMLNQAGCPLGGSRATTAPSDGCDAYSKPKGKSNNQGFSVSPVPFKDNLNIKYEFDYESTANIQIFDIRGNLVKSLSVPRAKAGMNTTINADFVRGQQMYIVKVKTDRDTFTKNVVSGK